LHKTAPFLNSFNPNRFFLSTKTDHTPKKAPELEPAVVAAAAAVLLITVNTRDLQQKQGLRKKLEKPKKKQKFEEEQYNSKKKKEEEEEEETPALPHLLLILRELAALCLESKNGSIHIRDLRLLREDVPHACGVLSPLGSSQQNYDIRKNRHKSRLTRIIRNRSQKNRKRN
jgi:flagellar biosynthesis component FlhA